MIIEPRTSGAFLLNTILTNVKCLTGNNKKIIMLKGLNCNKTKECEVLILGGVISIFNQFGVKK